MPKEKEYRYAEKLLYEYTTNKSKLDLAVFEQALLIDIGDVKSPSYGEYFHSQNLSDPVVEHNELVHRLGMKIQNLRREIKPVDELVKVLTNPYALDGYYYEQLKKVLEFVYFGRNDINAVCELLKTSKRTIYRRKDALVKMLIELMRE